MKATGEVMAIGRTFEEAIQKAIRSLDMGHDGFEYVEYTEDDLANPTDERLFQLYSAIKDGMDLDKIQNLKLKHHIITVHMIQVTSSNHPIKRKSLF